MHMYCNNTNNNSGYSNNNNNSNNNSFPVPVFPPKNPQLFTGKLKCRKTLVAKSGKQMLYILLCAARRLVKTSNSPTQKTDTTRAGGTFRAYPRCLDLRGRPSNTSFGLP